MFWCMIGFHKWPKWSALTQIKGRERFVHYGVPTSDWENRTWDEQNRTCERCGRYEVRTVE